MMISRHSYPGKCLYRILVLAVVSANPSFSMARQLAPLEKSATEEKATGFGKGPVSFPAKTGAGYRVMGEIEYGIAVDSFRTDFIKASLINGYRFNPFFSLGFGAGVKIFLIEGDPDLVIPLFLDARLYFSERKIAPYLSLGIGYALDLGYDKNGDEKQYIFEAVDIFFNPVIGVSYRIAKRSSLHIGIGCEMQSMRFYNNEQHMAKSAGNSTCVSINAGLSF